MSNKYIEEKKLRAEIARKEINLNTLKTKLRTLENKSKLKRFKEKYEGKYFKFINSTGMSYEWSIYSYCKKVKLLDDDIVCEILSFELSPFGHISIERSKSSIYFHKFQEKISKEEYFKARDKFKRCAIAALDWE